MDVIDGLAGIAPGTALDGLRERRPEARRHSQMTFDALFSPLDDGEMAVAERHHVAAFVAGVQGDAAAAAFYDGRQPAGDAMRAAVDAAVKAASGPGPYGAYPPGVLSREDVAGPVFRVAGPERAVLGARLAAAFEHAHMLLLHPRDAAAAPLQALLDAGWSATGIVTLSQLVAFLSYQIRVGGRLRVLAGHPVGGAA